MKRMLASAVMGLVGFCITYVALCYLVPGWRIKLEAEPMVYFLESMKSMALIKCLISAFAGILLAAVPYLRRK